MEEDIQGVDGLGGKPVAFDDEAGGLVAGAIDDDEAHGFDVLAEIAEGPSREEGASVAVVDEAGGFQGGLVDVFGGKLGGCDDASGKIGGVDDDEVQGVDIFGGNPGGDVEDGDVGLF